MLHSCLLDYENTTDVCDGCGSQHHKYDTCILKSKIISFRLENVQVIPQFANNITHQINKSTTSQDADWREPRPKRTGRFTVDEERSECQKKPRLMV